MMRSPLKACKLRSAVSAVLLLLTLITGALLSAQNPNGALRGEVQDSSGARVSTAQVAVESIDSSIRREAAANDHGEFRIDGLLPGRYKVSASAKGFASATSEVEVAVSFVRDLTITLKPGSGTETVSVQGKSSSITTESIDTANTVQGGAVSWQDLQTIPLAARSFANIAYLVPGTEPVEPSDPTKARITAVAFGGSSGLNVNVSVDGGDNSDDYIGGVLQNFSPDFIEEFAVHTAQEDADIGRTVSGSVIISTKRGSNLWHGSGAFYERGSGMNARYPIDNPAPEPKQPFSRQNYIGTIGGPIKNDKMWVFAGLEAVHENASISYSPDNLAQFNALAQLAADGLIQGTADGETLGVDSIAVPNNVKVPFRDFIGTLRFDFAQSQRSQWFLRGSLDNYTTNNDLIQQATLPSTGATSGSKYENFVLGHQFAFSPTWLGTLTVDAGLLHHTEGRNGYLGFSLAFPFSSTFHTISGFETFGDNLLQTPITAFPTIRNQEKYQFRYDISHASGKHAPKFGISFIHEPVLSGELLGTEETFIQYAQDPSAYIASPDQFYFSPKCSAAEGVGPDGTTCTYFPAGDGHFSQGVKRLGLYAEDSYRVTSHFTVNYGLRWDTTFGLFKASGRDQLQNPAYITLKALQIPIANGAPHDNRKQFGPRFGIAYSPGRSEKTVLRAGIGLYYNDLAQNGWVGAFQALNAPLAGACTDPIGGTGDNSGCLPGANLGGGGALIAPNYSTPYALHATAGIQHALNEHLTLSADYTHEQGNHAYRGYSYAGGVDILTPLLAADDPAQGDVVPNVDVYRSDNRSTYDSLTFKLQGNMRRANFTAHYTLARAQTWGCFVGELFDYVNGVCDPNNAFAPGDHGPSGEDVRHRFVLAGTLHAPGGFEISTLTQLESARPFVLGDGANRAIVNGTKTTLDQLRGSPFMQVDLRVARPFRLGERRSVLPFVELFNLFNRNNPSNNYVADVAALGFIPPDQLGGNITDICVNADCSQLAPITSLNQLRKPAGALGDFFGPGTTVGIPFAAQVGVRVTF
jgi:Carboxypeptidase regulatory-like domain/TonB dependent receptor